ncbi:MAG: MFS transporter [Victivallaceae bacterium]|nr:MFS transporter [Victivallaceae bacterium]
MNQESIVSYRSTIRACYTANFIGALVINLTPILFIPLKVLYHLTYTQFGILLAANFITQIVADVVFSWPTDRYGYRPFVVLAPLLTIFGYLIFALSPVFWDNPFPGFIVGTVIFSATGGLLELLLSAIVNGIPGEQKATLMSVLHSFYAWGQLTVVLLTTLAVYLFGAANWQWIIAAWALLPIINFFQFLTCRLPAQVPEKERQNASSLVKDKAFYIILAIIAFGGMSEVSMAMWTSVFLERAGNLPKILGDTAGMCLFAAMLGLGRLLYGIFGEKHDVWKFMTIGASAAVGCYLLAATCEIAAIALTGCVLCGLAVSLLWPGSVVLAGKRFPLAGAWLYAMLAAGGDLGASIGPYVIGVIADHATVPTWLHGIWQSSGLTAEQFGLRTGLFCGALFPLTTLLLLFSFRKLQQKKS